MAKHDSCRQHVITCLTWCSVMAVEEVQWLTDLEEDADGGSHSNHPHTHHSHFVCGPSGLLLAHVNDELLLCRGHLQLQETETHQQGCISMHQSFAFRINALQDRTKRHLVNYLLKRLCISNCEGSTKGSSDLISSSSQVQWGKRLKVQVLFSSVTSSSLCSVVCADARRVIQIGSKPP